MECQSTQSDVLSCSNGYYGYQPLLNGCGGGGGGGGGPTSTSQQTSHSNGHAAATVCWQRKRSRQDDEVGFCCGNGVEAITNGAAAAVAAKRLCPDLYHAKLQQALGLNYAPAAVAVQTPTQYGQGGPFQDGTEQVAIGTDSLMMMEEEEEGSVMSNGVETLHHNSNGHHNEGATLQSSHLPPQHTCCSIRTQLCTMSFQQSYMLSSTKNCPRCLAGEPAPYLSTQATIENLSKLY